MRPRFREDKATQAAALLLTWAGGSMNYMKLIKLLYLGDRTALLRWGRPISFARAVSMKHGPVLSEVLNLINEGSAPGAEPIWSRTISAPANYEVRLNAACEAEDLSDAEEAVLREVYDEYGPIHHWDLVDRLHKELPEWTPTVSSIPIDPQDILLREGYTKAQADEIVDELEMLAMLERATAT